MGLGTSRITATPTMQMDELYPQMACKKARILCGRKSSISLQYQPSVQSKRQGMPTIGAVIKQNSNSVTKINSKSSNCASRVGNPVSIVASHSFPNNKSVKTLLVIDGFILCAQNNLTDTIYCSVVLLLSIELSVPWLLSVSFSLSLLSIVTVTVTGTSFFDVQEIGGRA